MSLQVNNRSKSTLPTSAQYKSPSLINLDLRLDSRIARAEKRGYLSQRLTHFKKQLYPTETNFFTKHQGLGRLVLSVRKGSLQILKKSEGYKLPIEQMGQQKPLLKRRMFEYVPSSLRRSPRRTKKSEANNEEERDEIDKVFMRMMKEEEEIVDSTQYQRYLTCQEIENNEKVRKKEAEMKVETGAQIRIKQLLPGVPPEMQIRKRLLSRDASLRQQSHRVSSPKKVPRKEKEYGGWETPMLFNDNDL